MDGIAMQKLHVCQQFLTTKSVKQGENEKKQQLDTPDIRDKTVMNIQEKL